MSAAADERATSVPESRGSGLFRLHERRVQPEIMDNPALDPAEHIAALRGLSRLNFVGNNAGLIWPALRDLGRELQRPLRVLDIATGSGDVLRALARRAKRSDIPIEFSGCDISSCAIEYARQQAAAAQTPIEFFVHDVLNRDLPTGYDAIICSLFLHHLRRDQAVELIRRMGAACGSLMVVSDLNRTPATLLMTLAASYAFTRSKVVHIDGPRSVRAAFNVPEAKQLAHDAGLVNCTVRPAWPCRYLMIWRRPT